MSPITNIFEERKNQILNELIDINEETKLLQNVDLDDLATQLIERGFIINAVKG